MGFASVFPQQAAMALDGCDRKITARAGEVNPWFVPRFVKHRINTLKDGLLTERGLLSELLCLKIQETAPRKLSIVAAGNIPLVCWHDVVCALAYAAAHPAAVEIEIKLSSADNVLLPFVIQTMGAMHAGCMEGIHVRFVTRVSQDTGAILFTGGSHAEMHYQRSFFGKAMLIRTGRTSVAFLQGNETGEQFAALAQDCFLYFGLGCRNVTLLLVPQDFDKQRFAGRFASAARTVLGNHEHYGNAFRHAKACALMSEGSVPDVMVIPDTCIITEDEALNTPVGMLHLVRYRSREDALDFISSRKEFIQCVAGTESLPLGQTQYPRFTDYADGLNTLEWLQKLSY